jgi:hypothetical protein
VNDRERYVGCLTFGAVDRVPLNPGHPRESTLAAWHKQGLAESVDYYDAMLEQLALPAREEPESISLDVDFRLCPWYEEKVLEHKDGHLIVQNWMGNVVEISDRFDVTYLRDAKDFVTRKWHRFPVENRDDWERMKEQYDASSTERLPDDFIVRCVKAKCRETPLTISINGPFWQLREWVGFENLCMLFLDDPEFVGEMISFWSDFVVSMLDRILPHIVPDSLNLSEDMAYFRNELIIQHIYTSYKYNH